MSHWGYLFGNKDKNGQFIKSIHPSSPSSSPPLLNFLLESCYETREWKKEWAHCSFILFLLNEL